MKVTPELIREIMLEAGAYRPHPRIAHPPTPKRATVMRRPVIGGAAERPLTLAEQRARTRWRRPAAAIIAHALTVNRGLLERLERGMYGPDMQHREQYQVLFNGLYQTTREQIAALEMFARVDWS
jgi:hypothetical protein